MFGAMFALSARPVGEDGKYAGMTPFGSLLVGTIAEQLGVRFTRSDGGAGFEIAARHMSNAGLKKPNKGQDFITVIYVF